MKIYLHIPKNSVVAKFRPHLEHLFVSCGGHATLTRMRPRIFIPLAMAADFGASYLYQVVDPSVTDPFFNLLAELPIVALLIWMFLKMDERHRATMAEQRSFYKQLVADMMIFVKDIKHTD